MADSGDDGRSWLQRAIQEVTGNASSLGDWLNSITPEAPQRGPTSDPDLGFASIYSQGPNGDIRQPGRFQNSEMGEAPPTGEAGAPAVAPVGYKPSIREIQKAQLENDTMRTKMSLALLLHGSRGAAPEDQFSSIGDKTRANEGDISTNGALGHTPGSGEHGSFSHTGADEATMAKRLGLSSAANFPNLPAGIADGMAAESNDAKRMTGKGNATEQLMELAKVGGPGALGKNDPIDTLFAPIFKMAEAKNSSIDQRQIALTYMKAKAGDPSALAELSRMLTQGIDPDGKKGFNKSK